MSTLSPTTSEPLIIQGSLQVIAGRLCDVYGRKKGLFVGAGIWITSGLLTTFMPVSTAKFSKPMTDQQNLASINIFRAFAGIGAAIILPAATGIVGAQYPAGRKRTLAFVAMSAGESRWPRVGN